MKLAGTAIGNVTTSRGSPAAAARSASDRLMDSGVSRRTGLPQPRQYSRAPRANNSFRWSFSSVIVPTVLRELRTGLVWSMAIAGRMPSILSTWGLSMRSRNWRA